MASEDTQNPQNPQKAADVTPGLPPTSAAAESVLAISVSTSEAELPSTGKRQAFARVKRELSEAELTNPGVVRLLLELLQTSDSDCEVLRGYQERFHEADRRASVLEERLKSNKAIEMGFAVGLTLGGVAVGLAPTFWGSGSSGVLFLCLGVALLVGSAVMRIMKG